MLAKPARRALTCQRTESQRQVGGWPFYTHARRAESAQQVWVQKYPDVYNNARAYQYQHVSWPGKR